MNKTYQELCDENQLLRAGIRQLTTVLDNCEWCDLLTTDPDLGALESAIAALIDSERAKQAQLNEIEDKAQILVEQLEALYEEMKA